MYPMCITTTSRRNSWSSKAKILVASSSDKSGLLNGQTTKAVTPSSSTSSSAVKDNNKNTVRFTSSTGRDHNSCFKDTGPTSAMQIGCSEWGVSVPPLIRASYAGVEGIAALRDGEYPDEKSNGLTVASTSVGMGCRIHTYIYLYIYLIIIHLSFHLSRHISI